MGQVPGRRKRIVAALGGNAIVRVGERGTIEQQFAHAADAMRGIASLARTGAIMVLTHGNGPVVGNIVIRGEAARDLIPPMPLYIAGADSEGGVGLMLQQALHNTMVADGTRRPIATIVTQAVVDASDPAFSHPTKPIGPYLDEEQMHRRAAEDGWVFRNVPDLGWRRVVASPLPSRIVEIDTVVRLAEEGCIVIAAGGGGVPVVEHADGTLAGIDAVVDKDWAGALLAVALGADFFAILMEADGLYEGFGTPDARHIDTISSAQIRELLDTGQLDEGSIGPKVAAAAYAVDTCGCRAVLCATDELEAALDGRAGTTITP